LLWRRLLYSAVAGNMNTAEEAASPPDPSAELPFLPTPSSPGEVQCQPFRDVDHKPTNLPKPCQLEACDTQIYPCLQPFISCPHAVAGAANITRLSASGQRCQFPVLYNGELVTDCIAISGVFSCQASSA
jgi:hypothetical protein